MYTMLHLKPGTIGISKKNKVFIFLIFFQYSNHYFQITTDAFDYLSLLTTFINFSIIFVMIVCYTKSLIMLHNMNTSELIFLICLKNEVHWFPSTDVSDDKNVTGGVRINKTAMTLRRKTQRSFLLQAAAQSGCFSLFVACQTPLQFGFGGLNEFAI